MNQLQKNRGECQLKGPCFGKNRTVNDEVHSNRVLHRDLKPSNVMLTRRDVERQMAGFCHTQNMINLEMTGCKPKETVRNEQNISSCFTTFSLGFYIVSSECRENYSQVMFFLVKGAGELESGTES